MNTTTALGMAQHLELTGCRSDTLGGYLQGLGVWRVVTRLIDSDVRAHWQEWNTFGGSAIPVNATTVPTEVRNYTVGYTHNVECRTMPYAF